MKAKRVNKGMAKFLNCRYGETIGPEDPRYPDYGLGNGRVVRYCKYLRRTISVTDDCFRCIWFKDKQMVIY